MTRYFRLLDPEFRTTAAIFRIRRARGELHVERYDPEAGAWTEGPPTLLRFVNDGELGADEIPKAEADAMIAAGSLPPLPTLAAPR